jgi:hypothetical protein
VSRTFALEDVTAQDDTKIMSNEANDQIADLSQELASMGRGSLQRRILRLEQELKEAYDRIHDLNGQLQVYRLKELLAKAGPALVLEIGVDVKR